MLDAEISVGSAIARISFLINEILGTTCAVVVFGVSEARPCGGCANEEDRLVFLAFSCGASAVSGKLNWQLLEIAEIPQEKAQ